MRYRLDEGGYICAVSFGCYMDGCKEYTGIVPTGYNSLDEWASNACIQAYYISAKGNLLLDSERLTECKNKQAQEAIDNALLYRKDLYESDEVLESQYIRQTATGKVIVLKDIKTVSPRVKIKGVQPYEYGKIKVLTQGKNMMPCTVKAQTLSGVSLAKNSNGSVSITGTATANIEFVISDCDFALKANENYYLNLGGMSCELRFNDNGEIAQQYAGASGLINVPENIEVSQVVVKISNGQTVNTTFYPQLEYGKSFTSYAVYKEKAIEIDFSEFYIETNIFPRNNLYPSDTLYPAYSTSINYILIENGSVTVCVNGVPKLVASGAVGLFGSCSTIYANKDVTLEVEYSTNIIDVASLEHLQGKSTTTNQFKILKDGSIEAHNGYFSGTVEADNGYFKGKVEADSGYFKGRVEADSGCFKGRIEADSGYFKGEISWDQITNAEEVATKQYAETFATGYVLSRGYQNEEQVTTITKNTITTSYVNALKVKAGSVDAENITGTTIKGKVLEGVTGEFSGKITATSGEIGGFTIKNTCIYSGNKTLLTSNSNGVYLGTDGLSIGAYNSKTAFKATSSGEIELNGTGSLVLSNSVNKMELDSDGISFGESLMTTEINKNKVRVYDNFIDSSGLQCGDSSTFHTTIKGAEVEMKYNSSNFIKIGYNSITLSSGATHKIIHGTTNMMSFHSNAVMIYPTYTLLGGTSGYLGFFGSSTSGTCSKKKSVATITTPSSATASTIATKLNELINALKAYNLIG